MEAELTRQTSFLHTARELQENLLEMLKKFEAQNASRTGLAVENKPGPISFKN